MSMSRLPCLFLCASLAIASAPHPADAAMVQAAAVADPGAREGDRELTCSDIAREKQEIASAVESAASRRQAGGAVGRGLMGFARSVASAAAPSMIGGMGGNSYLGAIAAQTAGQAAGQAINSAGTATPAPATPNAAQPSAEQQQRLDRLSRISAFRQCAG